MAVTAAVAVLGLAVAVGWHPEHRAQPRDGAWNAMRAYLHEHDRPIDTIVTDDRDRLILGIYSRDPASGDLVVHANT